MHTNPNEFSNNFQENTNAMAAQINTIAEKRFHTLA